MNSIFINCDFLVELTGLASADGTIINSATVTGQLTDAFSGANIGSPVSLTTTGSLGNYIGVIPNATTSLMTSGQGVYVNITATYLGGEFFDKPLYVASFASS